MDEKLQDINEKLSFIIENLEEPKEIFTMDEACEYLCVGRTRFTDEVNAGKIRFKKLGNKYLFKKIWLDNWMEV